MTNRYDPLYASDLGASPADLGLLTSLSSAVSSIVAIPMGWAVEQYSVKKVMLFNIGLFLVHLTIMGFAGDWLLLIPAYVVSTRLLRMGPLVDIIFVTTVQPERRSTVISVSRVVQNVLAIFSPMLAAFVVTYFGGINAQGIRPLYFIQFAIMASLFVLVARYLPPTLGRVDRRRTSDSRISSLVRGYRDALKGEPYLQRWVALRVIQGFSTSLATPFIALWLVAAKGATPYVLGIIGSTSILVSLLLQIPAGRLADRYGRKKVYLPLRLVAFIGSFLAMLAPNPEFLIVAGLLGGYATGALGGGIAGAAMPLFVTWWWESVPEEKRGRFFGIEGLFGLASVPAAILGGVLWQHGYQMQVLLIPIIIQLVIVFPLLYTVPDIIRAIEHPDTAHPPETSQTTATVHQVKRRKNE
jgi:MFS family permease